MLVLLSSPGALLFQGRSLSLAPIATPSGGFSAPRTLPWGGGASRSLPAWQQDPGPCTPQLERLARKRSAGGVRCLEPV